MVPKRNSRGFAVFALLAALWLAVLAGAGSAEDFRFVVLGDCRGQYNSGPQINETALQDLVHQIGQLDPAPKFVLFLGDLAVRPGKTNFERWQALMAPIAQAGIPVYLGIGNHELYNDAKKPQCTLENQQFYQQFFTGLPDNPDLPAYNKLSYAFDYDNSAFIFLDTFYVDPVTKKVLSGGVTPEQLTWLDKLLAAKKPPAPQSPTVAHIFVFGHMPAYPVNPAKSKPDNSMRDLWEILDKHGISIYFAGHEHLYDRWIIDNSVNHKWTKSITQIITGAAGAPFDYSKPEPPIPKPRHPRHTRPGPICVRGGRRPRGQGGHEHLWG